MSVTQAFFLGIMVALTPSMIVLLVLLLTSKGGPDGKR